MAVHKKNWTSATQIIGTGDGYITLSGTTESFSSNVDMATNGYEGAHVIVEMDYDGTPTDEVEISIYGSLDGTNYDDTPLSSKTWPTSGWASNKPARRIVTTCEPMCGRGTTALHRRKKPWRTFT
ncbi:MAG: hypothetical protein JRJ78_15770 [Deltaproteobacteria bacterium]|nr:hypothetical protein [Deltaproteobacteria bacterium]